MRIQRRSSLFIRNRHLLSNFFQKRYWYTFLSLLVALAIVSFGNQWTANVPPVNLLEEVKSSSPVNVPSLPKNESSSIASSRKKINFDARFANRTLGYIADPTLLKRSRERFILQRLQGNKYASTLENNSDAFWDTLQHYDSQYREGTPTSDTRLSSQYVCAFGPGQGLEEEGGFKLLTEKIDIAQPSDRPRILCAIYTHDKQRDMARTAALSWGYKCDGFLAFSTETIPTLGMVDLVHDMEESYQTMWQKSRSIWAYVHKHYQDDYDFFHLGGDDMYVIVENMRQLLLSVQARSEEGQQIFIGQQVMHDERPYLSGGPGYTLNQQALRSLVQDALPGCRNGRIAASEDRFVSWCLSEIGVSYTDSRDVTTGEQQYHDCSPHHLFTAQAVTKGRASFHNRMAAYWETLPHPSRPNQVVGPKLGLEAAAPYSVSFHDLHSPFYMARIHAILHPTLCPADSPLGRAMSTTS